MIERLRRAARLTLLAALLPATACSQEREAPQAPPERIATATASESAASTPAADPQAQPGAAAAEQLVAKPQLSVPGGAPGTNVTVSMKNLAIGDSVEIGFGTFAEHQILGIPSQIDRTGAFTGTVAIPADAAPGPHYFFVAHVNGFPMGVSDAFLVTRADGTVRVRGTISAVGACPTLKGIADELYALSGRIGMPEVGAKLTVSGKLTAKSASCAGMPIEVTQIQADR